MQHKRRVIVVVGGMLLKDEQTGKFRTSTLVDHDNPFGMFGDDLRGFAAALMYHEKRYGWRESTTILILGGITPLHKENPHAPLLSSVIRQELEGWGVPSDEIEEIEMGDVGGTFQQLLHLQEKLPELKNSIELILLSNRYQIPRIEAMVFYIAELQKLRYCTKPALRFVAAEDVITEYMPEQAHDIAEAYDSPEMKHCFGRELNGALEIVRGTYKFPTKFPQR